MLDAPEGVTIKGNRELARRALANLLDNAIKYARPEDEVDHGVPPEIRLTASRRQSRVVVGGRSRSRHSGRPTARASSNASSDCRRT